MGASGCAAMGCGADQMAAQQMMMMRQQQMMMQMGQMAMMNPMAFMNPMAMMGMAGMAPMVQGMGGMNPMAQMAQPTSIQDLDVESEETRRILGQQAYANAVAAMETIEKKRARGDDEESEDELDDVPPGPSSNVHHPHYRPPDMEPVLGLTDRRFEGHIEKWFDDTGFGFIECDEITKRFGRDAFLHRTRRKHFQRGDYVSFSVFLDYRGKPQATELRKCSKKPSLMELKKKQHHQPPLG